MPALRPMSHGERILEVAREAGVDLERLALRWPAQGPHDLSGPSQLHRVRALWSGLMRGAQAPGIPIRVARRSSIDDCSVLGLAAKTAPDLRSALRLMDEYHALWTGTPELRVVEDGEQRTARVEVVPLEGFDVAGRSRREMIVAALLRYAREMAGEDLRPELVHFAHAAPGDTREHEAFFGAPIRFSSSFTGLELGSCALERPLLHADGALFRFLRAMLESLAAELAAEASDLERRVLVVIREQLALGPPRMEEVAVALGTSPRSLRRHLEARGLRYRDLLDAVRRDAAEDALAQGEHPVAEIAARLGYSEPSAFYRAFRRWTGGAALRDARARRRALAGLGG
jgi:AraC-like DNA-binding protein